MGKVVIIADDLTGANATSVLLVRQGFNAVTFLNLEKYNGEEHKDLNIVSISTDSRGNIGVEISAILENLPDDTLAIVVPSFPTSGRVCIGGYLMVNQVPLEKTDSLIGGLFTSGGDVTVAVCNALGSAGIEVKDEVLPLAVYGRITKLSNEYHIKEVTKTSIE